MNRFPQRFLPLFGFFLALLAAQLACGAGSSVPSAIATRVAVPTQSQTEVLPPAVPETRLLTLEFPPAIRAGDSDVVRLTLEVDTLGNLTPTAQIQGNVIQGQVVSIPNVYDTHNVLAEARLDMAGVEVRPADTISEPLLPGQKVTFYWSVRPAEVGKYRGTVWFYLHFVPKTTGEESRMALSSQLIDIDAAALFGLKAGPVRWLGVLGTFLGSVLGFPFLESVLKWVWGKVSRAKAG